MGKVIFFCPRMQEYKMLNIFKVFLLKQNLPMEIWLLSGVLIRRLLTPMTWLIECEVKYDERTKRSGRATLEQQAYGLAP